ncbi:hypothetical protein GS504_02695 [Rhodococcus hoagii]|nr:hypothetical protein [Prescottella equi]NKS56497.1 hypothetical protein [Prescottella equi]NKZ93509.1 hypothetical protein [Prescottella equi]
MSGTAGPHEGPQGSHGLKFDQIQGNVYLGDSQQEAIDVQSHRLAFEGWINWRSIPWKYRTGGDVRRSLVDYFDCEGSHAARNLVGDFVIAHVSRDERTVTLYRGIASSIALFWHFSKGVLKWAVDPLDILGDDPLSISHIDVELLPAMLAEFGMPPDRSIYKGVRRLPSGYHLQWQTDVSPSVKAFDRFNENYDPPKHLEAAAGGLRERLREATKSALDGCNSAAVLLSGGVDSAVAAAEAAQCSASVVNAHFSLADMPGFEYDLQAASSIARHTGGLFHVHDLQQNIRSGGDYLTRPRVYADPFAHVPAPGFRLAAHDASEVGAQMVLSGAFADLLFMDDWRYDKFPSSGLSLLNPLRSGKPIWNILSDAGGSMADSHSNQRSSLYSAALFVTRYLRGSALLSLPEHAEIAHYVGLTRKATNTVDELSLSFIESAQRHGKSTGWIALEMGFSVPHMHAGYLNDLRPHGVFHHNIFSNRDVIEYCLSLPRSYKRATADGITADKFLLRYAYSDGQIPKSIAWRTRQADMSAIPAAWLDNNYEYCKELLGPGSVLAELEMIDHRFVESITPSSIHRGGDKLARTVSIEEWLREFT